MTKPAYFYTDDPELEDTDATLVPVFCPTFDEFKSFDAFVHSILPYGFESSIVKIIPPQEWIDSLPDISDNLANVQIKAAIEQQFLGKGGIFTQLNMPMRKKYTAQEFEQIATSKDRMTPTPQEIHKVLRRNDAKDTDQPQEPHEEDWSVERCKELEKVYWRSLQFNPPLYGADQTGSLFGEDLQIWNPAHLDNLLLQMKRKLPGVNTPYLYFGMWKATFAWHVEDMDLFSINYVHFGAPKQWYSIPSKYREKFERFAQNCFPQEHQACSEFLRHKTFHMSPQVLAQNGIQVARLVQKAGEFVITFPRGYHAGYNLGYNCAESCNFAFEEWIEYGRNAKACTCVQDSVHINVDEMFPDSALATKKREKRHSEDYSTVAKKPKIKSREAYCVLCAVREGSLIRVDNNDVNKHLYAHEICAMYVPESAVKMQDDEAVATGISTIPRERWRLACFLCYVDWSRNANCAITNKAHLSSVVGGRAPKPFTSRVHKRKGCAPVFSTTAWMRNKWSSN